MSTGVAVGVPCREGPPTRPWVGTSHTSSHRDFPRVTGREGDLRLRETYVLGVESVALALCVSGCESCLLRARGDTQPWTSVVTTPPRWEVHCSAYSLFCVFWFQILHELPFFTVVLSLVCQYYKVSTRPFRVLLHCQHFLSFLSVLPTTIGLSHEVFLLTGHVSGTPSSPRPSTLPGPCPRTYRPRFRGPVLVSSVHVSSFPLPEVGCFGVLGRCISGLCRFHWVPLPLTHPQGPCPSPPRPP